jgi:hypothetical protein
MEIREFARKIPNKSFCILLHSLPLFRKIPNKSFLYFVSFASIIPHDSEQEFFVFCFIHFHYSARFRTRVFCILLHSLPLFRKIPNKSFLYFASFTSIIPQDFEQEFFVFCFIRFHYSARFRTKSFCILRNERSE